MKQNIKHIFTFVLCGIITMVLLTGCGGEAGNAIKAADGTAISKTEAETITTQNMSNNIYSIDLPAGWIIETTGQYTTFGFRAYDPNKPERQMFFYCKMEPFLKSDSAKNEYRNMANIAGDYETMGYHMYADMPVLYDKTTDYFFFIFNEFAALANKYGVAHNFTKLNDISVFEKFKSDAPATPGCVDNSIIRAGFTSENGLACEGLFAGQVTDKITYPSPATGNDLGFYCVYRVMGITARADEFTELQDALSKSLSSFEFTDDYINQTVNNVAHETERILAQAKMMQGVYESYNAAWRERQTTYDVISEKNSDANLGYERLYDTETGEIYRAESGIYDTYYKDSRLKKIEDSDYDRYLQNVDYYIYK